MSNCDAKSLRNHVCLFVSLFILFIIYAMPNLWENYTCDYFIFLFIMYIRTSCIKFFSLSE